MGQVAAISAREGQLWPELLPVAKTLCDSNDPSYLESGFILLDRLAEYAPSLLKPHVEGLITVFSMGMASGCPLSVCVAALKATCSYIHDLGDAKELQQCAQALVGAMLEVVQITLSAGEEDVTREALSALNTIAERHPKILIGSLEAVAGLMLSLTKSDQLDPSTRQLALEFLVSLCERCSSTIKKKGWFIIQSMIPLMLDLLAESDEDDEPAGWATQNGHSSMQQDSTLMNGSDEDDDDVREFAAAALDRCAMALEGDGILMVAAPIVSVFAASADWRRRRAALQGLAMLGEGCKEEMLGHLPTIIPPILKFSMDPHPRVRYQLNSCILQMSVDFCEGLEGGEESGSSNYTFQSLFHKDILPVLLASLELGGVNCGMPRIQSLACAALFHFCDYRYFRRAWLLPFAPALLEELLGLVSSNSSSSVLKEEAIGAATQLAQVLGPNFEPYCERFMLALRHLERNPGVDNPVIIRGRAIEAMVMIVCFVSVEKYLASLPQLMHHVLIPACATVQLGDPIVPFLFPAIGRTATVLKSSLVPYLPMVMPPLIAALSAGKAFTLIPRCGEHSNDDVAAGSNEAALSSNVTTVSCEIRGLGSQRIAVNTAAMEDTKRACQTVGHIAQALGGEFSGWAGECIRRVLPYMKRNSGSTEEVRSLSCSLLPRLLASVTRGGPGSSPNTAPELFQLAIESLMGVILEGPEGGGLAESGNPCSSHELEPYCLCADALCNCLKLAKDTDGAVCLRNTEFAFILDSLITCAAQSMSRSKMRSSLISLEEEEDEYNGVDVGEEDQDGEEDEWERDLLVSVVDSVGWVIKDKKNLVLPIFEQTLWPFCEILLSSEPSNLKHFAICMCVDVAEHFGPSSEPFLPRLLLILINMLKESGDVPELCQAAAYGLAVVGDPRLRVGGGKCVEFDPYATTIISLLLAQIHRQDAQEDDRAAATDKCVSGVLHLLTQHEAVLTRDGGSELQPPLIMLQLLSWMPLRDDILEAQSTHELVLDLIDAGHPLVTTPAALPHVVQLLLSLLSYIPTDDELDALHTNEEGARYSESDGGDVTTSILDLPPPTKTPLSLGEEPLEDMWERQLLSKKNRARAENILAKLKATQGGIVVAMWEQLDPFSQKWANISTPEFDQGVQEFRRGLCK